MNSSLDKKAYNDARYGSGSPQQDNGSAVASRNRGFLGAALFKLRVPSVLAISMSLLYGGYAAARTHDSFNDVAHQAFKASFFEITELWAQFISAVGMPENAFATSLVEFLAVTMSLFFALFAGIGGAAVYFFQMLING